MNRTITITTGTIESMVIGHALRDFIEKNSEQILLMREGSAKDDQFLRAKYYAAKALVDSL